jgi:hypothetical protein
VTTRHVDLLDWVDGHAAVDHGRRSSGRRGQGGLRFAFYGRTSTVDFQDQASSQAWQREAAESVVAGRGVIVAEYFDAGHSRRLPWVDRPRAAALLAALAHPHRDFDAIVVGEYERAFFADQLQQLLPLFDHHGVQLWLPETNGPLDRDDPAHQALLLLLGAQSRREVLRAALPARFGTLNLDPAPPGKEDGPTDPDRLAEALRTHSLIIVCDTTGWTLRRDPPNEQHRRRHNRPTSAKGPWGNPVSET